MKVQLITEAGFSTNTSKPLTQNHRSCAVNHEPEAMKPMCSPSPGCVRRILMKSLNFAQFAVLEQLASETMSLLYAWYGVSGLGFRNPGFQAKGLGFRLRLRKFRYERLKV